MIDAVGLTFASRIVPDYALVVVPTIGDNLKRIRGKREQGEIARRMDVGQGQLSNWETDRYKNVTASKLIALARAYECSVDDILRGVEGYQPSDLIRQGETAMIGPSEGRVDVPASPAVEASRLEPKRYQELVSETADIATRLFDIAGELQRADLSDRSSTGTESRSRSRARKNGQRGSQ